MHEINLKDIIFDDPDLANIASNSNTDTNNINNTTIPDTQQTLLLLSVTTQLRDIYDWRVSSAREHDLQLIRFALSHLTANGTAVEIMAQAAIDTMYPRTNFTSL